MKEHSYPALCQQFQKALFILILTLKDAVPEISTRDCSYSFCHL